MKMEEEMNHDRKEEMEEKGSGDEMEEGGENAPKELEPGDIAMEEMEGEGEEDTSLLEPGPGEEEEGEVDIQEEEEEKLLRDDEVSQDDQEEMSGEELLRNFIGSDFRDPTENEDQNLSELNINSPKDPMSDDDDSTQNLESQANANDSESCEISQESNYNSTKSIHESTLNYQEESFEHLLSSTTTELPEEEIILAEGGEGEEKGGEEEVVYVKEVRGGEEEQERRKSTREEEGSEAREGHPVATTDFRCKEVR